MNKIIVVLFLSIFSITSNAQIKKETRIAAMHYMDKNYTESLKDYTNLSKYKNPDDLSVLAQHYHYGLGTTKNLAKAIEYYQLAANKGDKMSQAELCEIYYDDEKIDDAQQQKNLYKYSRMFSTNFEWDSSTGITEDKARYALYLCYKNGWGTAKDDVLAEMWLAFAAFNDAMYAQDTFCKKYNINGDYDSDEEEMALLNTYFKHVYKTIFEYIKDDHSIEADYFRMYYNAICATPSQAIECLNQLVALYENKAVPKEGKAMLYDYLSQFFPFYKELSDKYKQDAELYELISDESKNTWNHKQFTKVVWKVDTKLNKSIIPTGKANNHDWVDLGLPSGRKWSTCNIGSFKPTAEGTPFAWGEVKSKSKFSKSNYKGNKNAINIDLSTDAARENYGDSWTIPSIEDWKELFNYCDLIYDRNTFSIIARSSNGQSVVLPLIDNSEEDGFLYWTDTNITTSIDPEENSAISLILNSLPDWGFVYANSWIGCQIRPVIK